MDVCDVAAELEQRLHTTSLAAHFAARRPQQAAPDGRCIDCQDAIDPQRLARVPNAARCVPCQTDAERAGR
jgi:RNA polymerase-binding transcription factor DksA